MKLQPLLVLVEVNPPREQDDSGVFITEEWKKLPPIGTVKEVGQAVKFCKPGDKVWFERFSAIEHPEEDNWRLCKEDMILAVLDEKG